MKLSKDLIALSLTLTVTVSLSGCFKPLSPNGQVAQTTASALESDPSLITRL
jgi:hypothetical protein